MVSLRKNLSCLNCAIPSYSELLLAMNTALKIEEFVLTEIGQANYFHSE